MTDAAHGATANLLQYGAIGAFSVLLIIALAIFAVAVWKVMLPLWREAIEEISDSRTLRQQTRETMEELLAFMRTLNGELKTAVRRAAGNDSDR